MLNFIVGTTKLAMIGGRFETIGRTSEKAIESSVRTDDRSTGSEAAESVPIEFETNGNSNDVELKVSQELSQN